MSAAVSRCRSAMAVGRDWRLAARRCAERLGPGEGASLGILYLTDALAGDAGNIVELLRNTTGIEHWVGTVGLGVCGTEGSEFDAPALAAMTVALPADGFRAFALTGDGNGADPDLARWLDGRQAILGLVHADPRRPDVAEALQTLSAASGAFLVGGLAASRSSYPQLATGTEAGPVMEGGLSGVILSDAVPVATALTQGCSPVGHHYEVTRAQGHVILQLDGRPALEVYAEALHAASGGGRSLSPEPVDLLVGLAVPGSDTGDYTVRPLAALDADDGWFAVTEPVEEGRRLFFVRRDAASAQTDLKRMLAELRARLDTPPAGAVYVTCIARGPETFPAGAEVAMIREALGDIPLVGFYSAGEISRDQLYGYTAVLTVFL